MLFQRKIDKIQQLSKEKKETEKEEQFQQLEDWEYDSYNPYDHLEADYEEELSRKDIFVLILSAFIAFSPIFIVLISILVLVYFI